MRDILMASLNIERLLVILRWLLFFHWVPSSTINAPTVNLGYTQYQGAVDIATKTTSFLGIRFAAAPVGNLRWAAPQPPPTASGVQRAMTQPSQCYQGMIGKLVRDPVSEGTVAESEDCLFLSVYTPGLTVDPVTSGGLPVLVWIHGGGYTTGSESEHNGADLIVKSNHSLIVVTIQYRLGLFGFLAGEAVKSGGALNAGLLDQNFALQWVQSHITAFGGDPTKVTIWGISAGGGSVLQHVIAHGGNTQPPLFRAAITSSACLLAQYQYNERIPEMLYDQVVAGTNCSSNPDTLSCLRAANIDTLQHLNNKISYDATYGTCTFVPVVDGTFVIEPPAVTLARGNVNGEALYSVTNLHEGDLFVNQSTTLNVSEYISLLYPDVQASQAAAAAPLYESLGTNVDQANRVMSESIFDCPAYYLLKAFGSKAWKGEFAVPPGHHDQDRGYYFTNETSEFITAFSTSFLAMAISLNPSGMDDTRDREITRFARWNAWSNDHTEMMFNVTSSGAPHVYTYTTDSALLNRCEYWRSIAENTVQ